MDSREIDDVLNRAEGATRSGASLSGTGFWKTVDQVKKDQRLVDRYADRIGQIDQLAFTNWRPWIRVPLGIGTALALLATAAGVALVRWTYSLHGLSVYLAFGAGLVVLLGSTHGLGHLLVGWALGIRFTSWFVARISQPQPGVKIDYASYLRASPRRRAWMHASGAIVTKLIPLAVLPVAVAGVLPGWVGRALVVLFVVMVATDVFWSTRASDWKRFRREMALAQDS